MIDQELIDFNNKLKGDVNSSFIDSENELTKTEIFTNLCLDIVSDSLSLEEVEVKDFQFSSKNNNKLDIQISGFSILEDLESEKIVHLFISDFHNSEDVTFITKKDFQDYIKKLNKFANDSIKGYFNEIDESLIGHELKSLANSLVKERNNISRIGFYFLTNTIVKDKIKEDISIVAFEDYNINYEIVDLERLNNINNLDGSKEPLIIDFEKETDFPIKYLKPEIDGYDDYECFLTVLPGELLSNLYSKYHTRLLEGNVRVFLQQGGKINKGIRKTITFEPKRFLAYNNGITATAEDVQLSDDKEQIISVKNFQIVNGGQTLASLHYTLKNDKKKEVSLKDIFVQVKLTVLKDKEKLNQIVPLISKYANSQNKVTDMDLTSNNRFFIELEKLSRSIYVSSPDNSNLDTHWYFERLKKQHQENLNKRKTKVQKNDFLRKYPKNQILVKSVVAKYSNIYNIKPALVSRNNINFNDYISKDIETDFNEKSLIPSKIYFEDLIANTILYKTVDKLYSSNNIGVTNLKAPSVVYALSLFHFFTAKRVNLHLIFKNQKVNEEIKGILKEILIKVYTYFAKQEDLASEVARRSGTFDILKIKLNLIDFKIINTFLISESDLKDRLKAYKVKESENIVKEEVINKIIDLGVTFWDGLLQSNDEIIKCFDETKINSILQKIIKKRAFTKSNLVNALEVINKIEELNFSVAEISSLSTLTDSFSEYSKEAVTFFNKLNASQLKDLITLGRSGNQKIIDIKESRVIELMFKEIQKGKVPDDKSLNSVFPKVLEINRKFKVLSV